MCQLNNAINNLLDIEKIHNKIYGDNRIEGNVLDYYWQNGGKKWNEDDVNNYFAELNRKLIEALNNNKRLIEGINVRLIVVMQEIIQEFGNINTLGLDNYIVYQFILRRLWENNDNTDVFAYMIPDDNMEIIIDPRCPICYRQVNQNHRTYVTLLSSWTKVLAAYDPTRFWIYDARVALALRFLSNIEQGIEHYNWFIPNSRANLQSITNKLNRGVVVADQQESYQRYLDLLLSQENKCNSPDKIIKTASHFEKRLFMLGGVLRDIYVGSDEDEKEAIIAIARARAN